MSKKRNKRNTKKFRKKLNKRSQFKKQSNLVKREVTIDGPKTKYPVLHDRIYKVCENEEFMGDDVEDLLYVTSYKTLPTDVINKIEKHISKSPIRKGNCHVNSSLLSLNIEGVKTVRGWYTDNVYSWFDFGKEIKENKISSYYSKFIKQLEKEKSKGKSWVIMKPIFCSDEEFWVNTETGDFWMSHSWNEYNGVYFDLSNYFQRPLQRRSERWINYKIKSKDDVNSIIDETKFSISNYKSSLKEINSCFSGSGIYELLHNSNQNIVMNNNYKSRFGSQMMMS